MRGHCGNSPNQTSGSLGPLSPTCYVMWAAQFCLWDSDSSSTKSKGGSLTRWLSGSFGTVVSRAGLTGKGSLSSGLHSLNRVRRGKWSGGFSRLKIGGPASVPSCQAGDSEQGVWLLSLEQARLSLLSHISLPGWMPEIHGVEHQSLCTQKQHVPSLPARHPPGHPSSASPGPCLQDPCSRSTLPLLSLFPNPLILAAK